MQFFISNKTKVHKTKVKHAKKCLETGHKAADCKNDWKCFDCNKSGHKRGQCKVDENNSTKPDQRVKNNAIVHVKNQICKALAYTRNKHLQLPQVSRACESSNQRQK